VSDKNVKITEEMKLNLPQNTHYTKYCLGIMRFGIRNNQLCCWSNMKKARRQGSSCCAARTQKTMLRNNFATTDMRGVSSGRQTLRRHAIRYCQYLSKAAVERSLFFENSQLTRAGNSQLTRAGNSQLTRAGNSQAALVIYNARQSTQMKETSSADFLLI